MACFLVPVAEAIVVTVIQKAVEKKEAKLGHQCPEPKILWSRKLSWLNNLLWGGVFLLAIEHIWHGEVVLQPPFLTAVSNPRDIVPMLHEMATVGVSMALFVTLVWGAMVFVAGQINQKASVRKHAAQED